MNTPFQEIYSVFLSNVESHHLATIDDITFEEELSQLLMNGISHFTMARSNIYDFNKTIGEFNSELSFLEIQILGKCMTLEYMNRFLLDEKLLESHLGTKDYNVYSPSNQGKMLSSIKAQINVELNTLMSKYSYQNLAEMFGNKK